MLTDFQMPGVFGNPFAHASVRSRDAFPITGPSLALGILTPIRLLPSGHESLGRVPEASGNQGPRGSAFAREEEAFSSGTVHRLTTPSGFSYEPPDPEDFRPRPRRMPGPFQRWPSRRYLFLPVLLLFLFVGASLTWWTKLPIQGLWVSNSSVFENGEFWRILTALFAHADGSHLLSNTLLFLFFGWMLRAYFGTMAFPVLPLLIGMASNLTTVTFYPPHVRLLGASGMIYGMVALWLVLYLGFDKDNGFATRVMRVAGFILIMMFPDKYEEKVSYLAHGTGFLFGLVFGFILLPYAKLREHQGIPQAAYAQAQGESAGLGQNPSPANAGGVKLTNYRKLSEKQRNVS